MKKYIKSIAVHAWQWFYLRGAFPGLQKKAVIFMLHRMSSPNLIEAGHSPEFLDRALKYLYHKGYNFVSLEDIYKNINEGGPPLEKAVAFTLDDGYLDQAKIAAPIFIRYNCPATIFLITGFVDSGQAPWDYFVKYIFYNTKEELINIDLKTEHISYKIDSPENRYKSMANFRDKCKQLSDSDLEDVLLELSAYAEKDTIDLLKSHAVPLSWDDARELEKSGISFGPHTISHSILSRCSNERAREEINGSWDMLTQRLKKPCPVFAYPTGRKEDFSVRDISYIKEIGLLGAVTAEAGSVNFDDVTEADKYLIKRMSFPSNLEDLIQYSSGFESVKQNLRDLKLKLKYTTKSKKLSNLGVMIKYRLGLYSQYSDIDWSKVSRVVFVCKGNICRSPYAEMRAKQLGINATSIGLYTKEGSLANTDALRNGSYRGISLEAHRARVYESIDFSNSDLVICMEPWHVELFKEVDGSGCQITLLGLLCSHKKIIISDPYGKPDLIFEDCFRAIDDALNNVKKRFQSIGTNA
jgi:protein-tyrosine-phosphatase/peptidoglycan/xylan/chitin deacetylase (PgdA/CDA1 family)